MKFPIVIACPRIFGWSELAFADRLKLLGLLFQAGAGVAMTVFAGYVMFALAGLHAVWPLFYLGMGALMLVGIIVTGFAGLLIARAVEIRGPGGFVFKSQDRGTGAALTEAIRQATTTTGEDSDKSHS